MMNELNTTPKARTGLQSPLFVYQVHPGTTLHTRPPPEKDGLEIRGSCT